MKRTLPVIYGITLLCLALLPSASAQVTTADLVGTITDQAGAVISNAAVTAENFDTHETRNTRTGASGDYALSLLPPGTYTLTITNPGFKTVTIPRITLQVGDRARNDAQLQVGAATQTVEVTAATPALQTDSSVVRDTVSAQAVQDLPLNGRNFVQLVTTAPGVAPGPSGSILSGTRPDERRQTANITANGQNERFNNQLVDGMDNNEREQGTILIRPSIDSLAEVHVDVNNYTAEAGRTGGAVINLITKSGTNQFHGGVYEFYRNDVLNANDFFNNLGGTPRPEYRQHQFGGSFGGPIKKNKTFFFGDIEELRQVQGQPTGLLATATAFELANPRNFSDVGGPVIPASRLDPVALKYFALLPPANIRCAAPGTTACATSNYSGNVQKQYYSTIADVRVDHHFTDNDSLFGRFSYSPVTSIIPTLYPQKNGIFPGQGVFPGTGSSKAQSYMVDYVHLFTPTLVMELKAGFTRVNLNTYPPNQGSNLSQTFGIPNANTGALVSGLVPVQIAGYLAPGSSSTLGDAQFIPILDTNNVFQEEGVVTWTHGAHTFKFGGGVIRRQLNYYQNTNGLSLYNFTATTAGAPPNSLANFLQGVPTTITRQAILYYQYFRTTEPHVFANDDWRVNRWLTLNLGVRWDYFSPLSSATGQRSNWQIDTSTFCIGDRACVQPSYKNFAPRLGFAANAAKGLVIRGGFGIAYFPQDYASGSVNLNNPPFTSSNFTCQPAVVGGTPCPAGIGSLSQGPPPPVPGSITNPSGSVAAHSDRYPPAYTMMYNLTVQKQIGAQVFTVAYVGNQSRHLDLQWNSNLPIPPGNAITPKFLRNVTLPNVQNITTYDAVGNQSYNSMQLAVERRLTTGLALSVNYTFARSLTNTPDNIGTLAQVSNNFHYDWGNADISVKHRINVRANYALPFGKSMQGFKRVMLADWQLNAIAFWQTGLPFTVFASSNLINLPNVTTDRPDAVAGQSYYASNQSIYNWINLNAFKAQPIGRPGSEGRNQLYAPSQQQVDISLFKDFRIRERLTLSLRGECFNIANTANFAQPVNTLTSFNPATGNPTNASQFGQITSTTVGMQPRVFQVALKLSF